MGIFGFSNINNSSYFKFKQPSFMLTSDINGGKEEFTSKEFEVYRVYVRNDK